MIAETVCNVKRFAMTNTSVSQTLATQGHGFDPHELIKRDEMHRSIMF